MIRGTLGLQEAPRQLWDVIVVGAGPAGAFAAHQLALRKVNVLLIDKASFPRWKVCGCCLNGQALSILRAGGLGPLVESLGGLELREVMLASGQYRAILPLPSGKVLSRETFDAGLVEAAQRAGAAFLPETHARQGEVNSSSREVVLRHGDQEIVTRARLVLVATGLAGRFFVNAAYDGSQRNSGFSRAVSSRTRAVKNSRIGAGTIAPVGSSSYRQGTIFMACGAGGYVGAVRLEDGRLAVAAAFDSAFVKKAGNLAQAASTILRQARLPPIPEHTENPWRGTPLLTRQSAKLASHRLFVLGDAAGFVEPFTGQGIAWALASGAAVTPVAIRASRAWQSALQDQWTATYKSVVGRRQWACRMAAGLLRRPRLTDLIVRILSALPTLAVPVLGHLNRSVRILIGNES